MQRNSSTKTICVSSYSSLPLTSVPDGTPKLWGPDWHCQFFANQLASRWNVATDYPHYDHVDASGAEAMLDTFCKVFARVQKTMNKSRKLGTDHTWYLQLNCDTLLLIPTNSFMSYTCWNVQSWGRGRFRGVVRTFNPHWLDQTAFHASHYDYNTTSGNIHMPKYTVLRISIHMKAPGRLGCLNSPFHVILCTPINDISVYVLTVGKSA